MAYDPKTYWQKRANPNVKGSDRAPQFMYDFITPLLAGKTKILELGPGTGRILDIYTPEMDVKTLDLSTNYHDTVFKKARDLNLRLEQNYLDQPEDPFPFADKTFDLGVSLQVLMHVTPEHIKTSLGELHRTCKTVAIIATNPLAFDSLTDHVFGHDYKTLCADMGAEMLTYKVHRASVCFTFQ